MRSEEEILLHTIMRKFHAVCKNEQLLQDGDSVLIGLSGGKDSLLLTELLGRQAQIFSPKIRVYAAHVRVRGRNYQSNTDYLSHFCQTFHVPFQVLDTEIGEGKGKGKGENEGKGKNECFLCSWYRRKALFDLAQTLGCNKIALGHHEDDVLQTLLMNLIYEGKCSTIMPLLAMDKMPLQLIRPLWGIAEKDIARYAQLCGYEKQTIRCPFERVTSRNEAATLLQTLEKMNPNVRSSLLHCIEDRKIEDRI